MSQIAIALVDHMGNDLRVANALRKSFDTSHAEWSETPRGARTRSDRELVEGCGLDEHELPFRHCQITLECEAPIPVARHLGKHQVGFSWSEVSRRYKTKGVNFYWLDETWRAAAADRRQGSGELLPDDCQRRLDAIQHRNITACTRDYLEALELGAAPEQARFLLPQSMLVRWTWTGSLLGFADLWRKRHHADTQKETRDWVDQAAALIAPLFPVSWAALTGRSPAEVAP